jgi:predicted transposase YdaD
MPHSFQERPPSALDGFPRRKATIRLSYATLLGPVAAFPETFPPAQPLHFQVMQQYDVALKNLLTRGAAGFLSRILSLDVAKFHNAELPEVRSPRVDLLGEARDGTLFHVELQSTNDPRMPFRMLDYQLAIERRFGRLVRQTVLYVGEAPVKMENRIAGDGLSFAFQIVDIRELDGEPLLESESLDDNIISILAQWPDRRLAVRRILKRIASCNPARRPTALAELAILAGLRSLGNFVEEESRIMPILTELTDEELFGPWMRRANAQGREQGKLEGERAFFLRQIAKRFGSVPDWVNDRIAALGVSELEDLGVRFLDVSSLEELFDLS